MDGVPMKELNVGGTSKAAIVFLPLQTSKQGEDLAHDEPYILRNGKHREVVIHTAEHVREFLRNDSKDHFRPTDLNFGDYFYQVLGQCVGALSGEPWRAVRRYFDPAYTHNAGLGLIPSFQAEVVKWLTALKNDSLRSGVGRMVVHAPTSCKLLPLRVIPLSFYGEAFDDEAYSHLLRISKLQGQALKYAVTGRWQKYRWYNLLPTSSSQVLEQYHRDWRKFNMGILETARNYLQTIDEMIFTNIDITGNVIAFMFTQLAKHPEFQQKLYEEIIAQKCESELDLKQYITQQSTLLHYLCLESVRLHPAIWFSVPEYTAIDKVIGRYKIPAQTPVIIDVRRLNTNALTWGPDGGEFRPERFASLSPNEYRYGFMRFGVVSGRCLGKHMADVLMKIAIITILKQYRIEEVEKNIGVKEGDLAFIQRKNITLNIRPRKSARMSPHGARSALSRQLSGRQHREQALTMNALPPPHILAAFGLRGTPQRLPGGQGQSYQVGDAVLKPVDGEEEEAEYISRLQEVLLRQKKTPGYRLAEPIPATTASEKGYGYVVDGWGATRLIPDCADDPDGRGRRWNGILHAGREFHADLVAAVHKRPAFIAARTHRWAKGDRIAWSEEPKDNIQIAPRFRGSFDRLVQLQRPVDADSLHCQLVHGDLAGNVLFSKSDPRATPAIIDLSLYWRPVEYSEAIVIADGLIWHGEGEDLVHLLGTEEFQLQMLVRALIFRIVASSEAIREADCALDGLLDEPKLFERAVGIVDRFLHSLET
ncbi:predicted protein [Uncinocarpus reesii 1704]|uniref:Aminoglycoside phosphotransferase domain-containing protein n=1 Tax=Uncinocarpus reesii (strain UAMH 1704) TaxID=336963 RepID=C4JVA3_UNCRE|nr:uncharacterized protein UREG_06495 [Uncinocarpus reesii 1704]EEP81630.1 predicted protein [Uncinocarpus reesii 1704]